VPDLVAHAASGEHTDLTARIRAWYEERPAAGLRNDEPDAAALAEDPVLAALHAELGPRARIADLGCGGGRLTTALASRGREVVGVDIAMSGLLHAEARRRRADLGGLSFVRGNLLRPPLAARSANAVLLLGAAEASGAPDVAVAAAARVVAEGGWLVLRVARSLDTEAPGATAHGAEEVLGWLVAAGLTPCGADPALSPRSGSRPLLGPHAMGGWLLRRMHAWRAGGRPGPQVYVARRG
jgi:SAM-dependent methyltransferase